MSTRAAGATAVKYVQNAEGEVLLQMEPRRNTRRGRALSTEQLNESEGIQHQENLEREGLRSPEDFDVSGEVSAIR